MRYIVNLRGLIYPLLSIKRLDWARIHIVGLTG